MAFWKNADEEIVAMLNHNADSELRLHTHPHFRSVESENEMLAYAEENYFATTEDGRHYVYLPIFEDDTIRQEIVKNRGYEKMSGWGHHYRRDLNSPIFDAPIPNGYVIRSMDGVDEYPSQSLASWCAFNNDKSDGNYDGDYSWYANVQSAPLYRRDLIAVGLCL